MSPWPLLRKCSTRTTIAAMRTACSLSPSVRSLTEGSPWPSHCDGASIFPCKEDRSSQLTPCTRDELYQLVLECTKNKDLAAGRQVHSVMVSKNLHSVSVLGDHLIRMFASCGSLSEAMHSFGQIANPSAFTWNAIIAAHVKLGESQEAVWLYHKMQQEGRHPPVMVTFLHILKACSNIHDASHGRLLHTQIISSGLDSEMRIASAIIDMYAKCGVVDEASKVFDSVSNRDVVLWGALIGGFSENGHGLPALKAFESMQKEGIMPNVVIFLCGFRACGILGAIGHGHVLHHHAIDCEVDSDSRITNSLIDMYSKCLSLSEACEVFCGSRNKDEVSWGALINGCVQLDECLRAIDLYKKMQVAKVKANEMIHLSILKACGRVDDIGQGRIVHDQIIQMGFDSDSLIECSLVDMYLKCKNFDDARKLFDSMKTVCEVSWNVMIGGYVLHGCDYAALALFSNMQDRGVRPTRSTLAVVLKACASIETLHQGRLIHDQILRSASEQDRVLGSMLVDMYSNCGSVDEAGRVFDTLSDRDVVSWNSIIACNTEHGHCLTALFLFEKMQEEGIKPDKVIYLSVLKACSSVGAIDQGRRIHEKIFESECKFDEVVGSTLIDMYINCGSLHEAHGVFLELPCHDSAVWSALIAGYVQHEDADTAIELFLKMQHEGHLPSKATCLSLLKACMGFPSIGPGMLLHLWILESGFESDAMIGSGLVDLYVKQGSLLEACSVFDSSSDRDVVSWDVMIAGYVLNEHGSCALELFEKMQQFGIKPDQVTFLSTLKACTLAGALRQGRLIHKQVLLAGFDLDANVGTALIDMYAKNGYLEDAYRVLNRLPGRTIISWGAIIAGSTSCSNSKLAKDWIKSFRQQGLKPDAVMFLSALVVCSHGGLLEEGRWYFKLMREDYGILPTIKHYNCLVDLLGRAGYLKEAQDLLQSMPSSPDIIGWLALLSGCKIYGNMLMGSECYDEVVRLDQYDASGYMLISNMYCDAHLWEIADNAQELRNLTRAWKKPGKAWLEIGEDVHEFVVEDHLQFECNESFCRFQRISRSVKWEGYVPDAALVYDPVLNLS